MMYIKSYSSIHKITSTVALLLIVLGLKSCETAIIEVNEIEFFIAKTWKISEVVVNGEPVADTDLSQYRLDLRDDFTFTRTTIDGAVEEGNWKLTAGLSQVVIFVNDPREERYLLIDLKVRKMELKLLQESFKQGELDIRYFLEPIKGQ